MAAKGNYSDMLHFMTIMVNYMHIKKRQALYAI